MLESVLTYDVASDQKQSATATDQEARGTSIDGFLNGKLRILGTLIEDIDREIGDRERLSRQLIDDNRTNYFYLKSALFALQRWPIGERRQIESRRSCLEKQLDDLNQAMRQEQVVCFQDVARLTVERRSWLKHYGDLLNRMKLLNIGSGYRDVGPPSFTLMNRR